MEGRGLCVPEAEAGDVVWLLSFISRLVEDLGCLNPCPNPAFLQCSLCLSFISRLVEGLGFNAAFPVCPHVSPCQHLSIPLTAIPLTGLSLPLRR